MNIISSSKLKNILVAFLFIIICQLAGAVGSLFTFDAIPGWYATLVKPELSPPNWVFGPVWTTLYTLMGISAFLIWKDHNLHLHGRLSLGVFIVQLLVNSLWTFVFFGSKDLFGALLVIVLLDLLILLTIIFFGRINKLAAWLLVPYLIWVLFATYLNFSFWQLN